MTTPQYPPIDWTKPVEYIHPPHGTIVGVLATDLRGPYPVVLRLTGSGDTAEIVGTYTLLGQPSANAAPEIRNVPEKPKKTTWYTFCEPYLNIVAYPEEDIDDAMATARYHKIAHILKITWDGTATPPVVEVVEVGP